jgi:hypothetical protein
LQIGGRFNIWIYPQIKAGAAHFRLFGFYDRALGARFGKNNQYPGIKEWQDGKSGQGCGTAQEVHI